MGEQEDKFEIVLKIAAKSEIWDLIGFLNVVKHGRVGSTNYHDNVG